MLTVAIEGDGIGKPQFQGLTESSLQGSTLTAVLVECHHRQTVLGESIEDAGCRVSTAIVHHDHVVALFHRTSHHTTDGSAVVIRRNHHANTTLTKHSLLPVLVCLCHKR